MVLPIHQQRNHNHYPNPMHHSPNQFMFPQRNGNVPPQGSNTRGVQGILQRFIQPSGGADIASRGAGGLSQTLNNVQQVLKVVQSTAPMIQEYGPMVKNLPAMYRMIKAFKDVESESVDNEKQESLPNQTANKKSTIEKDNITNDKPQKISGQSTPKLFI